MTNAAILGLLTAVPQYKHTQIDMHDKWLAHLINSHRSRAIFTASEIDTRYSILPTSEFLQDEPGTKARNDLFMQVARPLVGNTITQLLKNTGLAATDIDHFFIISCTGFDTPGLETIVAANLGMRPDLRRTALIGMGCYAGLTGLDRAAVELAAFPQSRILVASLEFTSIHFQHGSKLDDMIAGAIFGDGLATAIIGPADQQNSQPRILGTMTHIDYQTQDLMGVHLSDKGFKIHLSTRVSKILRHIVPALISKFLDQHGLTQDHIKFWGLHPGGAKIIDHVGRALNLEPADLIYSREVLRKYGNMSSTTIFFVLEEIMTRGHPQSNDYALLLAFGPGLTIELCLIQW